MARSCRDDLPDRQSEIFLCGGVDDRISVDLTYENEFFAHWAFVYFQRAICMGAVGYSLDPLAVRTAWLTIRQRNSVLYKLDLFLGKRILEIGAFN
jgi:hypothetical protein